MMLSPAYEVQAAKTIAEGWQFAASKHFDLIVLDSLFEDGRGVDLCRRIRAFDPRTPVIFFSALAQASDREQGLAAGAQVYLVKPNDLENLVGTAEHLLHAAQVCMSAASC